MLEPIENQYIKIGRVARPHGKKGGVLIISEIHEPAIFEELELVWLRNDRRDLVPARVETARMQKKDNRLLFFVKFDHIASAEQAEKLKKRPVFVSRDEFERLPDNNSTTLISFDVFDEYERRNGEVVQVIDNPAHPILVVQNDEDELLIPLVDEYVVEIAHEHHLINCRNLNRLRDVN
jgi:16S rRNA processing protein RimM